MIKALTVEVTSSSKSFCNLLVSEMPSYPAVTVANTFIERFPAGRIDHLKLQKLCYYAYGWWLAFFQNHPPLINVKPQVWKLGPVFNPIYAAFASYRGEIITKPQSANPFVNAEVIANYSSTNESKLIDWIWGRYGNYDGIQLSDMTHEMGTPWYNLALRHSFEVPRFFEMPDHENRSYFIALGRREGVL